MNIGPFETRPGRPTPLGATVDEGGVNFAVFSDHATRMTLCLFDESGRETQIDLPDPSASGLIDAARRLRRVRGVAFASLTKEDVVRHALVQRIIEAYGGDSKDSPVPAHVEGDA